MIQQTSNVILNFAERKLDRIQHERIKGENLHVFDNTFMVSKVTFAECGLALSIIIYPSDIPKLDINKLSKSIRNVENISENMSNLNFQ